MNDGATGRPRRGDALRLRASDEEDLQVLAACLQDALVPLREMAFMADDRRFMASFDRFQWEKLTEPDQAAGLSICQSILRIDHVEQVQYRGLDSELGGVRFELLTMTAALRSDGGYQLTLVFAGDVALRLQVGDLSVVLEDFGEPRPASIAPRHDLTAGSNDDQA